MLLAQVSSTEEAELQLLTKSSVRSIPLHWALWCVDPWLFPTLQPMQNVRFGARIPCEAEINVLLLQNIGCRNNRK